MPAGSKGEGVKAERGGEGSWRRVELGGVEWGTVDVEVGSAGVEVGAGVGVQKNGRVPLWS